MSGPFSAQPGAARGSQRARRTGHLAWLAAALLSAFSACRERVTVEPPGSGAAGEAGQAGAVAGAPRSSSQGGDETGGGGASQPAAAGGEAGTRANDTPPLQVRCPGRVTPETCSVSGDSSLGVRLIGTLLEPLLARQDGVLDIDAQGDISCAGCDCGDAQGTLVIDCPGLVIAPGFINLHDHLSYAGTPPLAHPGELYEHRNDWRLGENGHDPLPFVGSASSTQVLAHELRMLMGGATSIVGAGGRRGFVRNLDTPGLLERLLPGVIRSETFPLDDASGSVDSAACAFGDSPDTAAVAGAVQAYVAHIGEGTSERAQDELRCALGSLNLLGENSAVVHAMALTRADAVELAQRGSSVVWSPRSNLDLYGSTAPVALLGSLGVRVALGSDWLASGSMNLLRELQCARQYDDAVLGGYFGPRQLLRMVTDNAAWALGLEGRLGALAPGLVGDVALFSERGNDVYASVVAAGAADVRLVLRQGQPLYGDEQLISAFVAGDSCEALAVCGSDKRVCAGETGSTLADIVAAGEAVYPLFSCDEPEDEPSCIATVSTECPAGESECQAPAPLPEPGQLDADHDGVPDATDVCPRAADEAQSDADQDGRGDACDPCPVSNPGLTPCPLSIAQLRAPAARLPLKAAVRVGLARVSALRIQGAKGFYLEDGDHAPYSGIFAYTDGTTPRVSPGEQIAIQGYFDSYQGSDELVQGEVLTSDPAGAYAPLLVLLSDAADGSAQAAGLQSLYVRIENVEVGATNPDDPNDYDETGLLGGLRLDDLIYPDLDNTYPVGTRFSSVEGICGFSFGHQKVFPLTVADLVLE